jgi:hypothetical protein
MSGSTDRTDPKLTLEWVELNDGGQTLIFDRQTSGV